MTFIILVSSAIRIFHITLMMQAASSNQDGQFRPFNFTHLSIKTNTDGDDFVTRSIRNFEDCTRACARSTSCKFVNYRVRGHVCLCTHYIGEGSVTIRDDRRPGYLSWRNLQTKTVSDTSNGICPEYTTTQSWERDEANGTCTIVACGRPREHGASAILGNRYSVGSKLVYRCSKRTQIGHTLQTIVCGVYGQWADLHDVCGYTCYTLSNGTRLMLKVFYELVDKNTATERCGQESSSLVTVLSMEKLGVIRQLLRNSATTGQYWVDSVRVDGAFWRTSDGREQPMDDAMWTEYKPDDRFDNCARLRYAYGWILDDRDCKRKFGYICEFERD